MKDGKHKTPKGSAQNRLIGRVLGKYRLIRAIGSGAFASIYEAVHIHLNVPFAIKILHPAFMNHEEVVRRFFREAVAASQLQHENVVFIADYDVEEDVGPYIVMEYLEGRTLKSLLEEEGALPLELVGELSRQICQVLALAHRKGIVHRDLKPENIFLVAREMGRVLTKILDFGIAHLSQGSESITGAKLMGTPIYMAPEQFRGSAHEPSIDIYSFGVILYEMLTGEPPFKGQNVQQLGIEHLLVPAPELDESFPASLRQLQARLLAKSAEERPSDMMEVWELLAPSLDPAGRYPHWHCQEPRFTSSSMPAITASLVKKNSAYSLQETPAEQTAQESSDTWEVNSLSNATEEKESTQVVFDSTALASIEEDDDDDPDVSDTILSDEQFELPLKLTKDPLSDTLTPDPDDSLELLEKEFEEPLSEDLQSSIIIDDSQTELPNISETSPTNKHEQLDLLEEEGELERIILDEKEPLEEDPLPKIQEEVTGEIQVIEQTLEPEEWEKKSDKEETEVISKSDLEREILSQQRNAHKETTTPNTPSPYSPPATLSSSDSLSSRNETPFPAFPPLQKNASLPPLTNAPNSSSFAQSGNFPTFTPDEQPHSSVLLKTPPPVSTSSPSYPRQNYPSSSHNSSLSSSAPSDTLENFEKFSSAPKKRHHNTSSYRNARSQSFFAKLMRMGEAEKRVLIIVWLGVLLVLIGVTILLFPELTRTKNISPNRDQRLSFNAPDLSKKTTSTTSSLPLPKKKNDSQNRYRYILIETVPSRANLYIDNKFVGKTPYRVKRPVNWIFHATLRLKGYRTKHISYQVDESKNKKLLYHLELKR